MKLQVTVNINKLMFYINNYDEKLWRKTEPGNKQDMGYYSDEYFVRFLRSFFDLYTRYTYNVNTKQQ